MGVATGQPNWTKYLIDGQYPNEVSSTGVSGSLRIVFNRSPGRRSLENLLKMMPHVTNIIGEKEFERHGLIGPNKAYAV